MTNRNGHNFKILTADGKIKFTGTVEGSWKTLEEAQKLVNYNAGEAIYEYDHNGDRLWEIL